MLVKFLTKNATVYDKDRDSMEKKISARLSRYFGGDDDVQAFIKVTEEKRGFKVEITLPCYDHQVRAESSSPDGLYAAFDSALDVLERRMTKFKDKLQNKKVKREVPVEEIPDEEYQVVRVKKYELRPMTVQEAILNMELLGHEFYVFLDVNSNLVSTVYARKEGGYGLVVPE